VQGLNGANGGLVVIDVASQASAPLVNTGVGLPFNSPNDVAVHGPSGAILFSDPAYGYAQGFRPEPLVGHSVAMGGLQRSSVFRFTAHSKRWPWQMPPALPFLLVPDRIPPPLSARSPPLRWATGCGALTPPPTPPPRSLTVS
jgi:hypothetical protein